MIYVKFSNVSHDVIVGMFEFLFFLGIVMNEQAIKLRDRRGICKRSSERKKEHS